MLARERHRLAGEQALDDGDGFGQPVDAGTAGSKGMPACSYSRAHVARADAKLEAAIGEQVHGGGLARDERRMAEVVVEHQRADAQARGRLRRRDERHQRREEGGEVVRQEQGGVAELLGPARLRLPLLPRPRRPHTDTEPERMRFHVLHLIKVADVTVFSTWSSSDA